MHSYQQFQQRNRQRTGTSIKNETEKVIRHKKMFNITGEETRIKMVFFFTVKDYKGYNSMSVVYNRSSVFQTASQLLATEAMTTI